MKVVMAQIAPVLGDIEKNLQKMLDIIKMGKENQADLVVFPQYSLYGAKPLGLLAFQDFQDKINSSLIQLASASKDIKVVLGGYSEDFLADNDIILFENSQMRRANSSLNFSIKNKPFLCQIGQNLQDFEGFFVDITASHFAYDDNEKKYPSNTIRVNLSGVADNLIYEGASFIKINNEEIFKAHSFEEDVILVDTSNSLKNTSPILPIEERIIEAIKLGLKNYCETLGFKKIILGLSGGIDSALSAYFAVAVLGAENVLGITMPSKYSSSGSVTDSEVLASNLSMEMKNIPIVNIVDSYKNTLGDVVSGLAEENIQARIRGDILMSYSNRYGYLLLSTGNKSECAVGYCTLYGDMCGGLNLIADLPKTLVWRVSRYINKDEEIIPWAIINKAPSAELREGQKDQDSLPEYDILDSIVDDFVSYKKSFSEIVEKYPDVGADILKKIKNAEYKRRQATLGLVLSKEPFEENNIPLTQKFF